MKFVTVLLLGRIIFVCSYSGTLSDEMIEDSDKSHAKATLYYKNLPERFKRSENSTTTNPSNCTCPKLDLKSVEKQVTESIIKIIEARYDDSFFRKRSVFDEEIDDIFNEDENSFPNQPVQVVSPEKQFFSNNNPNAQLMGNRPINRGSNQRHHIIRHHHRVNPFLQDSRNEGRSLDNPNKNVLERSKRFCVPFSFDDSSKEKVRKVVSEAFQQVKI